MRDLHFRKMILPWRYMIRSTASQRIRTKTTMQLRPIHSLRLWRKTRTGASTHCAVDETSMPLTLGRAVIGINTVLMLSSRPTIAEVLRGMYQKPVQQIHLDNHRNEATLDTKGSRTTKISSMFSGVPQFCEVFKTLSKS